MNIQSFANNTLFENYPALQICKTEIFNAIEILKNSFNKRKKLLLCGNGGSAADCEHIVGELMKGFRKTRLLSENEKKAFKDISDGLNIANKLQKALPSITLTSNISLRSAITNDIDSTMEFAQQVYAYGESGDVLLAISTSGNAINVKNAVITAKVKGIHTIGLTGKNGGILRSLCDCSICVPENTTYRIQEYHIPIYHAICAELEESFFSDKET